MYSRKRVHIYVIRVLQFAVAVRQLLQLPVTADVMLLVFSHHHTMIPSIHAEAIGATNIFCSLENIHIHRPFVAIDLWQSSPTTLAEVAENSWPLTLTASLRR